jgi:purine nucleosidase
MALPIIIDCDPGTDDAIALMMAVAAPEIFNILGITTVGGNVSLELVTQNALKVLNLIQSDIKVYKGCSRPLVKPGIMEGDYVHGLDGLGGVILPEPDRHPEAMHGVDFIIEAVKSHPEPVTLVPIGPLTNIAMALVKDPSIKSHIREIVFMGGAMRGGNVPGGYAEFNVFNDPHAAHVVITSGLDVTMVGLDVTHSALMTQEYFSRLELIKNSPARFMFQMLQSTFEIEKLRYGFGGCFLHDPCVIAYLFDRRLIQGRRCPMFVEIASPSTLGQTVVDWHNWQQSDANVFVAETINTQGFMEVVMSLIERYKH